MNTDLLKAERELARGNPDEARVHAWNALATIKPEELSRLREVAGELDEKLLLAEIDRRGVPALEPPTEAKPKRFSVASLFPLLRSKMLGANDIDALDEQL